MKEKEVRMNFMLSNELRRKIRVVAAMKETTVKELMTQMVEDSVANYLREVSSVSNSK